MNRTVKLAFALAACAICLSTSARALSFDDFALMNNDDEAGYITLLVETSAKMLKANGHPDQADKVIAFFNDTSKDGGVTQLAAQLKTMHAANNRNATNPNNRAQIYQVEDAMSVVLKNEGIIVPAKYLIDACQDFRPSGPTRAQTPGQ